MLRRHCYLPLLFLGLGILGCAQKAVSDKEQEEVPAPPAGTAAVATDTKAAPESNDGRPAGHRGG